MQANETNIGSKSNGHMSSEGDPNNSNLNYFNGEQLIEEVPGTHFALLKTSMGYSILWGKFALTEPNLSKEKCLDLLDKPDWMILGAFITALIKAHAEFDRATKNGEPVIDAIEGL